MEEFYKHHRGGSGCVLLVMSYRGDEQQQAIFGSIELAQKHMTRLGDDWTSVIAPFVVDDPDWGNEN